MNTSDARSEWIRLNRNDDRKFYCVDDRPGEGNYQKWNDGEPNNVGGTEDCVYVSLRRQPCLNPHSVAIC